MSKLKLQIEELAVESFATTDAGRERGTVLGHDSTDCSYVSPQYTMCDLSCEFACGATGECTPRCPGGSGGCGGGTGLTCPTENDPYSGCDLSCEFAC